MFPLLQHHFRPKFIFLCLILSATSWESLLTSMSSYGVCVKVRTHTCRLRRNFKKKKKKRGKWRVFGTHTRHEHHAPYSLCPSPWWFARRAGEGVWFLWVYGGGRSPGPWAPARSHPYPRHASWHAACSRIETSCTVQERQKHQPANQREAVQLGVAAGRSSSTVTAIVKEQPFQVRP